MYHHAAGLKTNEVITSFGQRKAVKDTSVPRSKVTGAMGQRNEQFRQALRQDEKPRGLAIQEL